MNKLSSTKVCQQAFKLLPGMTAILRPDILEKFVIPDSYYDIYYRTLASKKYTLIRPTLEMARTNKVKLINTAEPYDNSTKPFLMPPYFTCFAFKNAKNEVISYVNAAARAGYVKDKRTGEILGTTLDENSTYAYLQTGAVAKIISEHEDSLKNNIKFLQSSAEIYALLINLCIDKMYPISGDYDKFTILNFLTAVFFLQYQVGLSVDRAIKTALTLKTVDPTIITNSCRLFSDESSLIMKSVDDFFVAIEKEFPFVKEGTINLRTLSTAVVEKYGNTAIFSIEHFQSFINMIQHVSLASRIYKDTYMRKLISPSLIKNIDQALLIASGE